MGPERDFPRSHGFLIIILIVFLTAMIIVGFSVDGFHAFSGFLRIQTHPARLLNDYIEIAGIGGALLNAASVGFIGLAFCAASGIPLSGPTWAAVLTMTGFGLFGKTPLNILPIILGVYIAARTIGKKMKDYLIIALFGTALGPLVGAISWELGFSLPAALLFGVLGGIITGFFLPSIAVAMLHLHQGYNLYNMGLSCGFFGLFAAAVIRGFGGTLGGESVWYSRSHPVLIFMIPVMGFVFIFIALLSGGKKSFSDLKRIFSSSGRLPSDFVDGASPEGALLNIGLIGILGSAYIWIVGGDFNGPLIGGLLTIMGFGAFGTHLKNSWPVVAGVVLAALATGNALNAPGPILAAIFCTTLAPLAGEFGIIAGIIAGIIHFLMVMQTGSWHGGMNLYNNGFAGGLTAAIFVSVIQWYRTNKAEK